MTEEKIKAWYRKAKPRVLCARNERMLNGDWSSKNFLLVFICHFIQMCMSYMVFLEKKSIIS